MEKCGPVFCGFENVTFAKKVIIFFLNLISQQFSAHLPMSSRGDEINATVDSGVGNPLLPVDVDLLLQVRLVLVINKLHDGLPTKRDQWRG